MSASAALALAPPPPPSQHSSVLSLTGRSASPLSSSSKRASASPPSAGLKTPVPASGPAPLQVVPIQQSPPAVAREPSAMQSQSTSSEEQHKAVSPAPAKLPEVAASVAAPAAEPVVTPPLAQPVSTTASRSPSASPNNKNIPVDLVTGSEQAPAQLALLLSSALSDADALRRELASEKKRAARAERLLTALQAPASPTLANTDPELKKSDRRLPDSAARAVLDAEARAEQAERARDDALHALASLSASFAEFERYEAACALRASDARGAFSRLLTSLTTAHPPPQSSPSLSTTSPREAPRLNLPQVPAPLPSLPPAGQLLAHGNNLPAGQSTRYTRPLPSHSAHASTHGPIDGRQTSAFDSLALPPPPSASGLGSAGAIVPSKRSYTYGSRVDDSGYDDQKRRRLALSRDMDMEMNSAEAQSPYGHRSSPRHPSQYQSGPPSAHPLSAHPNAPPSYGGDQSSPPSSARAFDRAPSGQYTLPLAPSQSFHRESAPPYAAPPSSAGSRYAIYDDREREYIARDRDAMNVGLVRVDARELVRDAKARERRERGRDSYVRHSQSQTLAPGERVRRRSTSRSTASSLSLDEMLLETATDRDRGRPSPPQQPAAGLGTRQVQAYGAPPPSPLNGITSPYSVAAAPTIAKAPSLHPATGTANGIGRKSSTVPASQLMTLGPSGTIVSGGGAAAGGVDPSAAAGTSVDPAVRNAGLRTCRQCGVPGRYKDGKCVEKWGPGPQGPGTVCDRCRKKMKRVERRGTLDAAAQASVRGKQSQNQVQNNNPLPSVHSQSFTQSQVSYSQPQLQSPSGRGRAPAARTDTLVLEPTDRERDRHARSNHSPGPGSRRYNHQSQNHPISSSASLPPAASAAAAARDATSVATHGHAHQAQQSRYGAPVSSHVRRAPTPPYITSISSREQYGSDMHGRRAELAPSSAPHRAPNGVVSHGRGIGSRDSSAERAKEPLDDLDNARHRGSGTSYAHSYTRHTHGGDERDELEDDADADGSAGAGSADADAEAEAEAEVDDDIMDAVDATMKAED